MDSLGDNCSEILGNVDVIHSTILDDKRISTKKITDPGCNPRKTRPYYS
jgi:hypothetical protein